MEQQVFDSEESTSSESGWTLYLQHDHQYSIDDHLSSSWKNPISLADQDDQQQEEDDDDMSMVSDASSGPPHFQEHQEQDDDDDDDDEYSNNNDDDHGHVFCHDHPLKKRRKILKQTSFHTHIHLQDQDTASSSFFTTKDLNVCDKEDDNSFDYSQGHSTTYFEMV